MGDLSSVLNGLNLSPVNTILLAGVVLAIKYIVGKVETRLTDLETASKEQANSISWIKGHIEGDESDG